MGPEGIQYPMRHPNSGLSACRTARAGERDPAETAAGREEKRPAM